MGLRGQRGGNFVQCRIERRLDFGALERLQEIAAERQRHQLGGREPERGNITEALHELPSRLPVNAIHNERITAGFERIQISADRTRIFRVVVGNRVHQLTERSAARIFQPPQEVPLTSVLIVARH